MLEALLGGVVWIIANFAYGRMVRDGDRGFRRFAAFWLGWPGTFFSYVGIKPARRVKAVDDRRRAQLEVQEEQDLLQEVRRDRARRIARGRGRAEGAADEEV